MPNGVINILQYDYLHDAFLETCRNISMSRSTSRISSMAVRIGEMLESCGHLVLALRVYEQAINTIELIDASRAEDYYEWGPLPGNPNHRYWSERMNDADALEIAVAFDALYHKLGMPGYAHQVRLVRLKYELLFRSVYSACL